MEITTKEQEMTRQQRIEELAHYNPRYALEGWAAGYRAEALSEKAEECEAAISIQESWQREVVQIGWDGTSNPIRRYADELHLPDHLRTTPLR